MSPFDPESDQPTAEHPRTAVARDTRTSESLSWPEGAAPTALPDHIGKYRLVEYLGRGGQAQVFLAVHPGLRRDVVIKWALKNVSASVQHRLVAEGRLLARLQDPGVVRVHDVDVHDGRPFLVFEYVHGRSLSAYLRGERPSLRRAVALVAQIAAIVARVHRQGVLHRDLKPANILLDDAQHPRLLDFGLAALTEPWLDESTLREGAVGTPAYMAPEQADDRAEPLGQATDVFGLGAILYELLTGQPPYRETDRVALWERIRTGDIVAPRELEPSIPRRLEAICLKALAAEPSERYASAAEFARALRGFLQRRWLIAVGVFHGLMFLTALGVVAAQHFAAPATLVVPEVSAVQPEPPKPLPEPPKLPPGWKTYQSEPGGYAVWFPGTPKESKSEVGERELHQVMLNDEGSGLRFQVVHTEYPGVRFGRLKERLDGARNGALHASKGKLAEETPLHLGKYPGRELLIEIPHARNLRVRVRLILVEQRLYQLLVGGPKNKVSGEEANRFFNSFQLTAQEP